jgi:hypothetical protein
VASSYAKARTPRLPKASRNGHDGSVVSVERVKQFRQSRFNPIRNLTPEVLSRQLDDFAAGYLRPFALTMDAIERRDDILQCVAPKRKAAVARRSFEVLTLGEVPKGKTAEAERHREALLYFYNNLSATDAVDMNQCGGFSLLVRQMLDAVGKRYAAHEILWEPTNEGLTATFKHVPLWFFENHTGKLRFLKTDGAWEGIELEEGSWMVTVGQGIMEACSVAYMFKHLPLKDWLIYCEKHGMPGVQGKTSAAKGSEQWNALVEAVAAICRDFSVVTSEGDKIEKIDLTTEGELPYPKIVERMDRAMASLWRGADLSTMSAGQGQGQGASLQGDESHNLECDDAALASETLQRVSRHVIEYTFGYGVLPLAYLKVVVPPKQDVDRDLKIDTFLRDSGAPLGVEATLERYGRTLPDKTDSLLQRRISPQAVPEQTEEALANELEDKARIELARALATDLQPVRERIARILEIEDGDVMRQKLTLFLAELPALLKSITADPESARAMEALLAASIINGMQEAKQ